ncbi:MAG: LysM peptidoglycan-binding domain-containing protein, partial [Thalassolituus sp.]
ANYQFSSVESADLNSTTLVGTANADTFDVTAENALTSAGITFTNVAVIDASAGADQLNTAGATAQLTATDNQVEVSGITVNAIENIDVGDGTLQGSSLAEVYVVTAADGVVNTKGMTVTSVATLNAGGGLDTVRSTQSLNAELTGDTQEFDMSGIRFEAAEFVALTDGSVTGSAGDDEFSVGANRQEVSSNGILFSGVTTVNGSDGEDNVSSTAAFVLLNGDTNSFNASGVRFNEIESGTLTNGRIVSASANDEEFILGNGSGLLSANDVSFTGVASVSADTTDAIVANSAGSDFVINADSTVAANDITFTGSRVITGDAGADTLTSNISAAEWLIDAVGDGVNSVADFVFSNIEALTNGAGDLNLVTSLQAVFAGDSVSFGDGAMTLNFDGSRNVSIESLYGSGFTAQAVNRSDLAISGQVNADNLLIISYGDIELQTDINLISIQAADGRSIDATIIQNGNLIIRSIDVGEGGTLILDSLVAGTGILSAETPNTTDVKGLNTYIGAGNSGVEGAGQWAGVGTDGQQLTFEVTLELDLSAVTFVTPYFPNGAPLYYNTEGNETDSFISSQSSALIINRSVGDVSQIDPAVFEALTPFIADANSVAGSTTLASSDTPAMMDTQLLATLLASYEPTAAGDVEGYTIEGEEKKKPRKQTQQSTDSEKEVRVVYNDSGEVIGMVRDYVFRTGDSLWSLSQRFLGTGFAWNKILEQNPDIENPSAIADGSVIKVIESVSDEVAQKLKAAFDSGLGVRDGNSVVFPAEFRQQLN